MSSTRLCKSPVLYSGSITTSVEYFCLTNEHMEKLNQGQEVDQGLPRFHNSARMLLYSTISAKIPLRGSHKPRLSDYM